jgi:putative transcriptional regulator
MRNFSWRSRSLRAFDWKARKSPYKALRADKGWTQADVAAQLDVSRQTIIAIEKGKFDPSLPLAFKAARLFELPIEQIFSDQT